MSQQTIIKEAPKQLERDVKPRCPYCGDRPVNVVMNLIQFGNAPAAMFFCGKCEKVLSVAPLPMVPGPPQPQERPSSLFIPRS
jgi:hypothetical protein